MVSVILSALLTNRKMFRKHTPPQLPLRKDGSVYVGRLTDSSVMRAWTSHVTVVVIRYTSSSQTRTTGETYTLM